MNMARHRDIRVLKFSFVSNCKAPTFSDRKRDGIVWFIDNGWRVVKRAVAVESFYGSSKDQNDTVLVLGDRQEVTSERRKGIKYVQYGLGTLSRF